MFETEALHKIVMTQLATIPDGKTTAVVAVANNNGAKIAFASKINDEWQVTAYAEVEKGHGYEIGASVQWSK